MTKLANLRVYGCCILLLFGTISPPFRRNYNFELLVQKNDRAFSVRNSKDSMCVIMKCNTVQYDKARPIDVIL